MSSVIIDRAVLMPGVPQYLKQRKTSRALTSSDIRSQLQLDPGVNHDKVSQNGSERKLAARTREILKLGNRSVELSVSSYDTAWVAMVPSRESKGVDKDKPLFPQCLEWVMKNQQPDGSWSLDPSHPLLLKDTLSSTLACVLALAKWDVGQLLVHRGLQFVEANSWAVTDKKQLTPVGFDIIFPGMISSAIESGLGLPFDAALVDSLLQKRETEINRCDVEGQQAHLAYLLEGLCGKYDWDEVMKHYQRSNGSLFNSPSATAAALIHHNNDKLYHYLSSLLKKCNNMAVPTADPLDIYIQLSTIDNMQKLAIDRYFEREIEEALDNIYRYWLQGNEEIVSDVNCCAMGFRLLRMKGYDVSSDALAEFEDQKRFFRTVSGQFKNSNAILELRKASFATIKSEEPILEKIQAWTGSFLNQELLIGSFDNDLKLKEEVEHALRYGYDTLDRFEGKRNLKQYDVDKVQLLKTSYRSLEGKVVNRALLELAVQDYNECQLLYRQELENLERWLRESRLDELKFARQKLSYCYTSTAAILIAPESSEARISMTKNSVMATIIDDFFDFGGSHEELKNMIQLFEEWMANSTVAVGYCSERVEILFSALETMINELGTLASHRQGRIVTHHLAKIWHDLLKSMMKEADWARENVTPTLEEYMENACISFALGPVLFIPLFSIGPKLSEQVLASEEYHRLFKLVSLIGRLLNDLASVKREGEEGKLNSVSLRILYGKGGAKKEEEAVKETRRLIECYRRELLRMVLLETKRSTNISSTATVVPKTCKDFIWKKCHVLHYFYKEKDGYSCPRDKVNDVHTLLWEPVLLPSTSSSNCIVN